MVTFLEKIGSRTIFILEEMGRMLIFLIYSILWIFTPPFKFSHLVKQINFIGVKSLFVILLTSSFTGMVLSLQGYYTLRKFGSDAYLGVAVALSLVRELGPVLTALMVTGRAGSAMTAEIGIMRITEQIDALVSMAVNPLKYLMVPRILAGIIAVPILTAIFDLVGIFGGYLVGVKLFGVSPGTFFAEMRAGVGMNDVTSGFIKSICFGLIFSWVSCYKGYVCGYGAEGVNKATTESVVMSSVLVLVFDYFLTSILL